MFFGWHRRTRVEKVKDKPEQSINKVKRRTVGGYLKLLKLERIKETEKYELFREGKSYSPIK